MEKEWDERSQLYDTYDQADWKLEQFKAFWSESSKYTFDEGRVDEEFVDGRMQYRAVLHIKSKEADIGSATYGRRY